MLMNIGTLLSNW